MVLLKDESIKNDEVRYVKKMKILFWNVHRNTKINSYLVSLVKDNAVDVLMYVFKRILPVCLWRSVLLPETEMWQPRQP